MKIEVNDYVRTKDGIKKVLKYTYNEKYENGHCVWFDNKDYGILFTDEEVNKMKPSPNIIDLIEVGDYVNGLKVQEVNNEIKGFGTIVFDKDTSIMEDYIYSIVTKEQFSSMEYKIGDE